MKKSESFENLRSISLYRRDWQKIHGQKLSARAVMNWVNAGRLVSHKLGANALLIVGGLEVEKRPRGVKGKMKEVDAMKYCERCERFYDDLPKHMKQHEITAERVRKFEERKLKERKR